MKLFMETCRHMVMNKTTFKNLMSSMNLHPMYMTAKEYTMLIRKFKGVNEKNDALWQSLIRDMESLQDKYEQRHSFDRFLTKRSCLELSRQEKEDLGHKFEEAKMFIEMGLKDHGESIWQELESIIQARKHMN